MKTITKILALTILVSLTTLSLSVSAQSAKEIKNKENKAVAIFKDHKYGDALPLLLELRNISKNNDYDYMIGICYIGSSESSQALAYFRSALSSEYKSFVINYYLGRAYMIQGNYIEAANYLNEYNKELTEVMASTSLKFKSTGHFETEENRVHNEKTPEKVKEVLSYCQTMALDQQNGVKVSSK